MLACSRVVVVAVLEETLEAARHTAQNEPTKKLYGADNQQTQPNNNHDRQAL